MENITYETIQDGNIEPCRALCNELMAFQKAKATICPELFDGMNFDTRMKKSFEAALDSHVVVVRDQNVPVGYVFSSIESIGDPGKATLPDWAPPERVGNALGFYPAWDNLPEKCGCLNNLYLRKEYRGSGMGTELFQRAMRWFRAYSGIELVFVYVSNGNEEAMAFYTARGFAFSHDVFGGFIKAAYCHLR